MRIYSLFYIIIAFFACIPHAHNHRVQEASSSNLDARTKKSRTVSAVLDFLFCGEIRIFQIATCRWHVAATSSKTGGYHNFVPAGQNANESRHSDHISTMVLIRNHRAFSILVDIYTAI